jgi:DNA polymerase III alpha subunit
MQMAIDVAGFTPTEADQLRQAMGPSGRTEAWPSLARRFDEGMAERASRAVAVRSCGRSWPRSPTTASPRATR